MSVTAAQLTKDGTTIQAEYSDGMVKTYRYPLPAGEPGARAEVLRVWLQSNSPTPYVPYPVADAKGELSGKSMDYKTMALMVEVFKQLNAGGYIQPQSLTQDARDTFQEMQALVATIEG